MNKFSYETPAVEVVDVMVQDLIAGSVEIPGFDAGGDLG